MKQMIKLILDNMPLGISSYIYRISLKRIYKSSNAKELSYFFKKKKGAQQKYVILRMSNSGVGIFAIMRSLVFTMEYWTKRNFIPIIDYEYDDYFAKGMLGEHNIWDNCFAQPLTVKEALTKEYVFIEDLSRSRARFDTCLNINENCWRKDCSLIHLKREGWREYYKNVNCYLMKWLVKSDLVHNVLKENFYSKIKHNEFVIGVMMREEFSEEAYKLMPEERKKEIDKHPRVPDVDMVIQCVEEYMNEHKINNVFLSTCHIETIEKFQEKFGDKVFFLERARTSMDVYKTNHFEITASQVREELRNDWGDTETEIPVKYVSEIYALAECDYLLGAPSGGMVGAMMINGGKYKDVKILEDLNKSRFYC